MGFEVVFGLLVLICFIVGLMVGMNEHKPKSDIAKVTVSIERAPAKETVDKTVYNEAKANLQLYGFSVKEAKDLLDKAGPHNDADEWARTAMEKVKI